MNKSVELVHVYNTLIILRRELNVFVTFLPTFFIVVLLLLIYFNPFNYGNFYFFFKYFIILGLKTKLIKNTLLKIGNFAILGDFAIRTDGLQVLYGA